MGISAMTKQKEPIRRRKQEVPPPPHLATEPLPSEVATPAELSTPSGTLPSGSFPIVGIGASAGGLGAFEAFFSGMPAEVDPGMAFVLVQHLAPDHESILADLIRRYTRMEVFEVEDGMVVQPNCAYIIPPGRDMAFLNGSLQLLEPSSPRGQRLPIDFFFRSLAQDQGERAIGIVLSGTGSDGTQGVRAIKGEGGMVMAQNPESTEYDGMPRSAIATGLVDYELPPAEMAAQLMTYATHAFGRPPRPAVVSLPKVENALKKIFILLRAHSGHDFSLYKPSTIHRRIERRMAVHQIDALEGYVKFLQQTPTEVEALFRDLLIGVTNFFRDQDVFRVFEEQIIPKIFDSKPAGGVVRVWTAGCSTGEEAYSIAILLQERMEAVKQSYTVQLFATDIDSAAIATARSGIYPASIAADLSPERLARFFTAEPTGSAYRINKGIRDMLVFSEQDVIKDPPFSKLDLISCRNLLIYMSGDLQKKLIPLFHYALNPGGTLFLGTSETVGDFGDLFASLDRKSKIFHRKDDLHSVQRMTMGNFYPPATAMGVPPLRVAGRMHSPAKLPLRELTEQVLLQQVSPSGALVNGQGDILYLHGHTSMYLALPPGEMGINNILKMAREGLRRDLTMALHKATGTRETVRCPGLRVKTNGHITRVNLSVHPVAAGSAGLLETPLYLVNLEEAPPLDPVSPEPPLGAEEDQSPESELRITALHQELRAKEEYLQTANEELETSNEELKSSNEEMQSVNEELQSTNEELETSKEELQSVNEELATVNSELQTKVGDLSQANNDMNNLLAGTGIGTVFVDMNLRILRFTPTASKIINLILSDVGRPVGHIVSNLVGYNQLVADTKGVLDTLIPRELDVQTPEGKSYTMRIQPYRTLDNRIEGAVITFVDITEMKQKGAALRESEEKFSLLQASMDQGMAFHEIITDADGLPIDYVFLDINDSYTKLLGVTREMAIGKRIREVMPKVEQYWIDIFGKVALTGESSYYENYLETTCKHYSTYSYCPKKNQFVVLVNDITERKQAEESMRKANEMVRLAVVVRDAHDAITVQDMDGRILAWNPGAVRMYGWSELEALEMNVRDRIPKELRTESLAMVHELSQAGVLRPYQTQRISKDGKVVEVSMISTALVNEAGKVYAIATTERLIDTKIG